MAGRRSRSRRAETAGGPVMNLTARSRSIPPPAVLLLPWALVYGAFFVFPFVFSFALAFLHYNPLNTAATSLYSSHVAGTVRSRPVFSLNSACISGLSNTSERNFR